MVKSASSKIARQRFINWLQHAQLAVCCSLENSYSQIPYTIGCVFDCNSGTYDIYETNERGSHESFFITKSEVRAFYLLKKVLIAKSNYYQRTQQSNSTFYGTRRDRHLQAAERNTSQ